MVGVDREACETQLLARDRVVLDKRCTRILTVVSKKESVRDTAI